MKKEIFDALRVISDECARNECCYDCELYDGESFFKGCNLDKCSSGKCPEDWQFDEETLEVDFKGVKE